MRRVRRGRRAIALLAPALALGLAAGCRDLVQRVFATPVVTARGARLESMDLVGGRLEVELAIANPNPYPLTATGATYRVLAADSIEVGRGSTTSGVTIGAHDSAAVTLPIDLRWDMLARAGSGAIRRGALDYRVVGTITASTPAGAHDFPLDARGRVKVPALFR